MDNYCQSCIDDYYNKNDNIIDFEDIKIENIKIEQLFEKIKNNNIYYESYNIFSCKIIDKNNGFCEKLSTEEEKYFNDLINIIINDFKNYPNFSHFFNIKNLLYFFNIEDRQIIQKEIIKLDNKIIKNEIPIIIEYHNNILYKTKLFSKIFVKNNKKKFKIEIEGQILDLMNMNLKEKIKR